jgi:outer membrane receptor protein involved in Fe transport
LTGKIMAKHRAVIAAALSGASLLVLRAPAAAENGAEAAAAVEPESDILVTATRPAYRGEFEPLEIPQAEQVIGPQQLRDVNALDLNSALDLSASVARQNNFGGLWNSFAVRGFVGDENLPSNYLVNGFNAGRGFAGPRDLSGIEAVEVLKGPRAALFGRGEPGGTINLVTKRPRFESSGEVRLLAGSFDTYRATRTPGLSATRSRPRGSVSRHRSPSSSARQPRSSTNWNIPVRKSPSIAASWRSMASSVSSRAGGSWVNRAMGRWLAKC